MDESYKLSIAITTARRLASEDLGEDLVCTAKGCDEPAEWELAFDTADKGEMLVLACSECKETMDDAIDDPTAQIKLG